MSIPQDMNSSRYELHQGVATRTACHPQEHHRAMPSATRRATNITACRQQAEPPTNGFPDHSAGLKMELESTISPNSSDDSSRYEFVKI